jgi:hypothetical protein
LDKDFLQKIKDVYASKRDYTFGTPEESRQISECFTFGYLNENAFIEESSFGGVCYLQNTDFYPLTPVGLKELEQSKISKIAESINEHPVKKLTLEILAIGMSTLALIFSGIALFYR